MADHVRCTIIGTTAWSGTYEGKRAVVTELLASLAEQFTGANILRAERLVAEGDLVVFEGRNHSVMKAGPSYPNRYCCVFVMRDGKVAEITEYVILLKLPNGHNAEAVRQAMTKRVLTLPAQLRRSITWDQGCEMSQHVQFTIDTGVQVYFCDPKSPWQRGEQREHQRSASPIPAQVIRSLAVQPTRTRYHRPLAQYEASTDTRLDDTISGVRRGCCVDRLRTQPHGGTPSRQRGLKWPLNDPPLR